MAVTRPASMLALAAALALPLADSAVAGDFLPHRAVYALTRAGSRASQTVAQIGGTMMIELDESCEGWSLSQRVRLTLIDALGDEVESDSRYASYETKDGTMLRFQSADWQSGSLVEETAGMVERAGPDKPGMAEFTRPAGETAEVPPHALFPAAFNLELLRLGDGFHSMLGFDGGNLDGAYMITAYIGKPRPSAVTLPDELTGPASGAVGGKVRNVRVAYFPLASGSPEPEIEYSMELQPNGVSPTMELDYQRYQVKATLVEFTALPTPRCGR